MAGFQTPGDLIEHSQMARYRACGEVVAAGTTVSINSLMSGLIPGGSESVPGMVTTGSYNYVAVYEGNSRLRSNGALVWGRLTVVAGVITGTLTCTKRSMAVVGVGTSFLTALAPGQLIRLNGAAEAHWAEIDTIEDNTHLTLVRGYRGTTGSGAAQYGDWQVAFYTGEATVESVATTVEIHALEAKPPHTAGFIDSVLDPRKEFGGGGITLVREEWTEADFAYDGGDGFSTIELAQTPSSDSSTLPFQRLIVGGVEDTQQVEGDPDSDTTIVREYSIDGTTLKIGGNISATEGGSWYVVFIYPV
jgi:hypothetical protein